MSALTVDKSATLTGEGFSFELGGNVTMAAADIPEAWSAVENKIATYTTAYRGAYYSASGAEISYVAEAGKSQFEIEGIRATAGISVSDKTVTLTAENLAETDVKISDGWTLVLGTDATRTGTVEASWHLRGTTAEYYGGTTAGYELKNNQVNYVTASDGETLIIVDGVKDTAGLSLSGNVVTISSAALNGEQITISEGYTLALADGIAEPVETLAHFDSNVYKSASKSAGYTLAENKITYTAEVPATDLFTLSNVKTTDGISVDGNTVTLTVENLDGKPVTLEGGDYQLKLSGTVDGVLKTTAAEVASLSAGKYTAAKTAETYTVAADGASIIYAAQTGGDSCEISGLSSSAELGKNVLVDGTTITLNSGALTSDTVTINEGWTPALGEDVTKTSAVEVSWHLSGTTAEYYDATPAGYELENNQVRYVSASNGQTLIKVDGVKSLDGVSHSGKVVTISAAALNEELITISEGYKLALAEGIAEPKFTDAHFDGNIYKSASNTAGYTLADNKITYTAAVAAMDLFELSGGRIQAA